MRTNRIFCVVVVVMCAMANIAAASCLKQIWVGQSSLYPTPVKNHHFIINQIHRDAPQSIVVLTSDGQQRVVPLTKRSGPVAHYSLALTEPLTVLDAWTWIYPEWSGRFNESTTATGVTVFGFMAISLRRYVLVQWKTASEVDVLGFNLYRRRAEGQWVKLNTAIISSVCLGSPGGAGYSWLDLRVLPGVKYSYLLEVLDIRGGVIQHGPTTAGEQR